MTKSVLARVLVASLCLSGVAIAQPRPNGASGKASLQTYPTKYYDIHTDLTEEQAREADVRMTKMAEEYHARTKDFAGQIDERLSFYLFRNLADYSAAGGMRNTAGVFDGEKLMAVAGEKLDGRTWHVVQHEGFHQFAQSVIRGDLPIWVNEGLAEYFGEAIFTGDSFVSGIVPQYRLERVQESIRAGKFKSIKDMMLLTHARWNAEMNLENYDQAWSMVHFLAHGDKGKYQKAFTAFMIQLNQGHPWDAAWRDAFGSAENFETVWKKWWLAQDQNPSEPLYARATVATLTSFVSRAFAGKQTFESFDAFEKAATDEQVKSGKADWLPPALLADVLKAVAQREKAGETFSLQPTSPTLKQPVVVMESKTGRRVIGTFTLRNGRVNGIKIDVIEKPAPKTAKSAQAATPR